MHRILKLVDVQAIVVGELPTSAPAERKDLLTSLAVIIAVGNPPAPLNVEPLPVMDRSESAR